MFGLDSVIFCEALVAVCSPDEFPFEILGFNGKIGLLSKSSLLGLKNVMYVLVKTVHKMLTYWEF